MDAFLFAKDCGFSVGIVYGENLKSGRVRGGFVGFGTLWLLALYCPRGEEARVFWEVLLVSVCRRRVSSVEEYCQHSLKARHVAYSQ